MKKILTIAIALFLLPVVGYAATTTYTAPNKEISFQATTTTTTATIAFTAPQSFSSQISLSTKLNGTSSKFTLVDNGTDKDVYYTTINITKEKPATLTIKGLLSNTTYYLNFGQRSTTAYSVPLKTDPITSVAYTPMPATKGLRYSLIEARSVIIDGKITVTNPVNYKEFNDPKNGFRLLLEYVPGEPDLFKEVGVKQAAGPYKNASGTEYGIADDGTYYYRIDDLNPGAQYCLRETITSPDGKVNVGNIDCGLNGERGYAAAGSTAAQEQFEKQSYRLLAPLPGLSTLLDPQICAQQKANLAPGTICDINDLVGFLLRILIGITAVFLVGRIMFEGYNYMVSDIPTIKTSSKGKLVDALLGLLLALSSYLILNTINPKLVQGGVTLPQVENGVTSFRSYAKISAADYAKITGKPIKAKAELIAIAKKVALAEGVDICLVATTIQHESSWDQSLKSFSADANYYGKNADSIPSRVAFIKSGNTYNGSAIPVGSTATSPIKNDDAISQGTVNPSKTGYGIDWRFSVGIGLMQLTLFPEGYNSRNTDAYGAWAKSATIEQKTLPPIGKGDNAKYKNLNTLADFLDPEKNITAGVQEMKRAGKDCLNDPERFLKAFNGGNCNSQNKFALQEAASRYQTYLACKKNGI